MKGDSNAQDCCNVSYGFNNNIWYQLFSIKNSSPSHIEFLNRIRTFEDIVPSSNQLYIELEAIGDDTNDCCIYDNVVLPGYGCI